MSIRSNERFAAVSGTVMRDRPAAGVPCNAVCVNGDMINGFPVRTTPDTAELGMTSVAVVTPVRAASALKK